MALLKDPNPQNFENIYAKLGLVEIYALIGDETALKMIASNLVQYVNKERLLNIIDSIYNDERNHRSLMDSRILLSEIGKRYLKAGEDCFQKVTAH